MCEGRAEQSAALADHLGNGRMQCVNFCNRGRVSGGDVKNFSAGQHQRSTVGANNVVDEDIPPRILKEMPIETVAAHDVPIE
jgi:hypothetical protein